LGLDNAALEDTELLAAIGRMVVNAAQLECSIAKLGAEGVGRAWLFGRSPRAKSRAESVLTPGRPTCHLPAETARWSTITQIYEGTNQIQRMVMARQLLKG
jgi:alkylation response protein AidB-like acyl-CoA dehydrogenase